MHIDVKTMLTHFIADAEKDAGMKTLKIEEAITILEDMKVNISIPKAAVTQIKRNAALNMAIDALLKCSEIPNDSDTISRQAAIDAVDVLCQEHRYRIPGKRETYSQYNEAWQDALDRAEVAIGNLPSVQPATNCSEIPNGSDDTISRQATLDALDKRFDSIPMEQTTEILQLRKDLRKLPSAQPKERTEKRTKTHACDCISRQMLLECIHGEPVGRLLCDKYNLDGLIEQFPSAQPEPTWISCSERLPEEGSYLVWMPFAPPEERIAVAYFCDGYWNIKTPISAWMPLPEPYRGGEKE